MGSSISWNEEAARQRAQALLDEVCDPADLAAARRGDLRMLKMDCGDIEKDPLADPERERRLDILQQAGHQVNLRVENVNGFGCFDPLGECSGELHAILETTPYPL